MTIGERMKQRRKDLNLSADEVAQRLGVSRSTIFRYENGGIEKLPISVLEPLSDILRTTPEHLIGWEDDSADIFSIQGVEPVPEMKKIPLLGTIACGVPILAEENIEDYVEVPKNIEAHFALICKGNSMINARILDGDLVLIRRQDTIENGEIAAVLIENEATLKRVYLFADMVELRAENPTQKPMRYYGSDMSSIHILGKAIFFMSTVN